MKSDIQGFSGGSSVIFYRYQGFRLSIQWFLILILWILDRFSDFLDVIPFVLEPILVILKNCFSGFRCYSNGCIDCSVIL